MGLEMICINCKLKNDYAEANLPGSKYCCYDCRPRELAKGAAKAFGPSDYKNAVHWTVSTGWSGFTPSPILGTTRDGKSVFKGSRLIHATQSVPGEVFVVTGNSRQSDGWLEMSLNGHVYCFGNPSFFVYAP